jgi:RNA-directed DNA polymerase
MPEDAPLNSGAPGQIPQGAWSRVSGMQAKLHRWAAADPGRRFDDLFNFVHDPATLLVTFGRVAGNKGAHSRRRRPHGHRRRGQCWRPGVPGRPADVPEGGDVPALAGAGTQDPQAGGSGKIRSLGIPTVADRIVQAALKLVLEPIFEADFEPVSYGFRPKRRAQDAIAEIHYFGTRGYRWVLDADIEAAFDNVSHAALMGRVRLRVKDKRVLALVKAFLKAGILTELGDFEDTHTGTPQGGILSPLIFNVVMSVLDEHLHGPWKDGGSMSTESRRAYRRRKGSPTWQLVRYCDDGTCPRVVDTSEPGPGRGRGGGISYGDEGLLARVQGGRRRAVPVGPEPHLRGHRQGPGHQPGDAAQLGAGRAGPPW